MDTAPFSTYRASYSPFDIFKDARAASRSPTPWSPSLPEGPCNFVDLAHGPNGVKCGCRRFWGRQVTGPGSNTTEQMGWCMCSHHACFHDDVQKPAMDNPTSAPAVVEAAPAVQWNEPGQENEKPRSNRTPLSPVLELDPVYMLQNLDAAAGNISPFDFDFTTNVGLDMDMDLPQARPQTVPTDGDSMPDTLSWRNVASTNGFRTPLPPPSECIPPSQSGFTTASQMGYLKPFGGKGLNTLRSVSRNKNGGVVEDERVIPSNEGHPPDDAISVGSGATTPTPLLSRIMGPPPPPLSFISTGGKTEALQNLTDAVEGHETRIDKLETGSIYAAAHEECSDKHDLTDLRLTELESRVDFVEKQIANDDASVASSRRTTQRDYDTSLRAALPNQIETLQARVNHLEASSSPSYSSPWELEVVFMPFPLKGIWQGAQEFKTPRLSEGRDEWTQLPSTNTNARATPEFQTRPAYDEWVGEDSDWLLPRAFVPGRTIDQRLRSRGLIKAVSLRGGDARTVKMAVDSAFESILRLVPNLTSPRSPYAPDPRVDRFFGLQQPWVPLRKVHKDARLRFLSPAELLTPVLWNAAFLADSVVMKAAGVHRLYITQPEAYLQDSHLFNYPGAEPGWTWQRLREFARVYPESQTSTAESEVPEADALEAHWSYNARLDEPPRAARQPSLSPLQERTTAISRTSDGSTEQFYTGPSNPVVSMMSPVRVRAQSPLVPRDRLMSHPPSFLRAGSVPRHSSPLATTRASPRLSISTHPTTLSVITKHRRRSTRSPSVVRGGMHNTPRVSNRSYSRSPSVGPRFQNVYFEDPVRGERRITPFAYATPHSNAPPDYPPPRLHSRSVSRNGDRFEDMDENMTKGFDGDRGSSTESEDDDLDIDVYQDEEHVLDDMESDSDHHHNSSHPPAHGAADMALPGIEGNMVDGETFVRAREDDDEDSDMDSDVSSSPSEYPSRQPLNVGDGRETTHGLEAEDARGVGFSFHNIEDEEEDEEELGDDDDDDEQGPW